MDSMGVVQAQQGVVNQANKNSAQETDAKAREQVKAPAVEAVKLPPQATKELAARVQQILQDLENKGVELPKPEKEQAASPGPSNERDRYIEVLRDVLVGEQSVDGMSFGEYVQQSEAPDVTPKLPTYPFDRSYLQMSLQYLKTLVSGEGAVDRQLAQRIESQLEALHEKAQEAMKPGAQIMFEQIV